MTYFDNAATTYPKTPALYNQLTDLYKEVGVNASRGKYKQAASMKDIEQRLRTNIATLFGLVDSSKVVLTPSSTISLNQILQGIDYSEIKTVYISPFEHNSVYRPLLSLQEQYGFALEVIPFDGFEWNEAKTNLAFQVKQPELVVLNHASNVFGNILPVKQIFDLAKQSGSITVLDASQTASLLDIDLKVIKADFVSFAGHKTFYGPSGIGGFVINSDINLNPVLFGGTGINSEDIGMPETYPERFEVGSMNSLGIIGLDLSLNWLLEQGLDNVRVRKQNNFSHLFEVLSGHDEITLVYGEDNVGIVSCLFEDYSPQDMALLLDEYNVSVRVGLHCAPLAHKHMNTVPNGTVRFSVGYFNTPDDFDKLEEVLKDLI